MRAFVFPGQGSQKIGMGVELAEASAAARAVFEEVDEALGQKLFAMMRDGPEDALTLTENAQPAIMANAIATLVATSSMFRLNASPVGEKPNGEISTMAPKSSVWVMPATSTLRTSPE